MQWHPDVTSVCATVAVPLKIIFSFSFSPVLIYILNMLFSSGDYLMYILTTAPRCAVGVCQWY